jgi:pyruvate dehydrogenase E2 component (dihydrolipoamide acetyltransferase)
MSEVTMPRLSDTMEEGELARWLKNVGDPVAKGDVIAEIETDKATMDLEAFEDGVLEKQLVEEGTIVPIGEAVAVIGDGSGAGGGEKPADAEPAETRPAAEAKEEAEPAAGAEPSAESGPSAEEPSGDEQQGDEQTGDERDDAAAASTGDKPRMSPVARKLARDHDIDLATLKGTGPNGRIIRKDIEAAIEASAAAPGTAAAATAEPRAQAEAVGGDRDSEKVTLNRIRKVTAKRLTESQAVPHFFLTSVVDMERLIALRAEVNQGLADTGVKISINDFIVKAVALALRQHPDANASWNEDSILRHGRVNIGVAVATEAGLLVPVVKDADRKTLSDIAAEIVELAGKAREGKLGLDEMTGGTFSVSNLGMFGIDEFTAMLNPPEAGILAVGAASPVPVLRDGQLVEVPKMKITLTVDHRAMDGATGAAFLRDLTSILEQPLRIVV